MNNQLIDIDTKNIKRNLPFIIYSDSILVKGYRRSIICDTGRNNFKYIPNSLYEIIIKYEGKSINQIKKIYEKKYHQDINDYFNFLLQNEFIFFCNEPELFPKIKMEWDTPSIILQAIIDYNKESKHNIVKISTELNNFNCKNLQLRFYFVINISNLEKILSSFNDSTLQSIELIIPFDKNIIYEEYFKLSNNYLRINSIIIYNAPYYKLKGKYGENSNANIQYIKNRIENENVCGIIDIGYFAINLKMFTESQKNNTCLNRKISIDVNGEIKNCPSMTKSYGNIKNTTLKKALEKPGFKDMWYIHKDQIEVCKDCEFRHICTDCRAYLKNPKNIYSQPEKCYYNPYIAKWKDQEGYITVEEWRRHNPY